MCLFCFHGLFFKMVVVVHLFACVFSFLFSFSFPCLLPVDTLSLNQRTQTVNNVFESGETLPVIIIIIIIIIIYLRTARAVGAPQMISQPVSYIFPCSPLPSGTCRTPGLSIPGCFLPISSSVCLVFFPLLLCFARWFWPDLMNGRHDHTTAVCASLRSSGSLCAVQ